MRRRGAASRQTSVRNLPSIASPAPRFGCGDRTSLTAESRASRDRGDATTHRRESRHRVAAAPRSARRFGRTEAAMSVKHGPGRGGTPPPHRFSLRCPSVVRRLDPPAAALDADEEGVAAVEHELEAGPAPARLGVPPALVDRPRTRPRHDRPRRPAHHQGRRIGAGLAPPAHLHRPAGPVEHLGRLAADRGAGPATARAADRARARSPTPGPSPTGPRSGRRRAPAPAAPARRGGGRPTTRGPARRRAPAGPGPGPPPAPPVRLRPSPRPRTRADDHGRG